MNHLKVAKVEEMAAEVALIVVGSVKVLVKDCVQGLVHLRVNQMQLIRQDVTITVQVNAS